MNEQRRILLAKTGLDGHWRGPSVVAKALRDGGFEVIMIGMTTVDEIVQAALDEDVDLVGLSIGGHVEVAERAVLALREAGIERPVFAGGVVPPWARKRLEAQGVEVYPPGSQLPDIVAAARRLTGLSAAQ
ncbi:MAG: cobalamin-binding protein [Gammaproteobacteria bacterium]|nr:MAG: cobalamin-binding protein [Gammaproteobacteria bacterium]